MPDLGGQPGRALGGFQKPATRDDVGTATARRPDPRAGTCDRGNVIIRPGVRGVASQRGLLQFLWCAAAAGTSDGRRCAGGLERHALPTMLRGGVRSTTRACVEALYRWCLPSALVRDSPPAGAIQGPPCPPSRELCRPPMSCGGPRQGKRHPLWTGRTGTQQFVPSHCSSMHRARPGFTGRLVGNKPGPRLGSGGT